MIPTQFWYDSLREADDGRFSSTILNESMDKYPSMMTKILRAKSKGAVSKSINVTPRDPK